LHLIVGVVRDDVLVLGLDANKQLKDETPGPELIADQRRGKSILALEGGRQVNAIDDKRAVIR
jgi:hypothetical protein